MGVSRLRSSYFTTFSALLVLCLFCGKALALADAVANPHPPIVQGNVESLSGQAVAIDSAGNRYIAGSFNQDLDFNPYVGLDAKTGPLAPDKSFAFVTRFNADGSYAWTQTFGGTALAMGNSVIVSADGTTVFLAGSFNCIDAKVGGSGPMVVTHGGFDAYVLALDAATGAPKTGFGSSASGVQVLGGTNMDDGAGLALSGTTLYLTGDFSSTNFHIGSSANTVSSTISSTNAFIAAMDISTGQAVSTFGLSSSGTQVFGGINFAGGKGVSVSGSTLFVCGEFNSSGAQIGFAGPSVPSSNYDTFILSLNAATGAANTSFGMMSSGVQTFGGTGIVNCTSIVTNSTTVYVSGYFFGGATGINGALDVPYAPMVLDAYVLAVDSGTGSALPNFGIVGSGVQTLGGSGSTQGFTLALSNSTLYLGGTANNSDTQIGGVGGFGVAHFRPRSQTRPSIRSVATISGDAFVLAMDPVAGTATPTFAGGSGIQLYGGSGTEYAFGMALKGNTLYVGGPTDSTDTYVGGVGPFDSTGFASFLIPIDATTGSFNRPPTALALSNATVPENVPVGTQVGLFSTTDPDAGNTFTYTLVSGAGSTDNAAFSVSGAALLTATAFNFPVQSSYSIRMRSTDQGGEFVENTFVITITEVNSPPSDIALSSASVPETSPIGSTVGTFSSTDPEPGSTFVYALVPGVGSNDNAAFTLAGATLKTATTFNFPTQSSYSIRVRSSDPRGLFFEKAFVITIVEVNSAPTDIALSNSTILTTSPVGTVVGNLSSTDPDPGSTFVYSLVPGVGGTDNALFSIAGASVKTNVAFSNVPSTFSIRVRSADPRGLFFEKAFVITLTPVNNVPTDIALSNSTILASSPLGTIVGALSSTDPDTGSTFVYSLVTGIGATDNANFAISGASVTTNALFNVNSLSTFSIRIRSTDQGGLFFEKAFVITVTQTNNAPTDIALSNSTIPETSPIGTKVGTLSTTDPDTGSTFVYTLVSGAGSTDNASFAIAGADLISNTLFNFTLQNSYSVRVRSTDQGGLTIEKVFVISVIGVNGAPTDIALSSTTVLASSPVGTLVGALSTTNAAPSSTFVYAFVPGVGSDDNAAFSIVGSNLFTNVLFDFNTQYDFNIRVRSTDSKGMFVEKQFLISLTPESTGIINVSNKKDGVDTVTNPENGVGITVMSSSGGVITLGIDVNDGKKRRNVSATSEWGDIAGRSSVTKGLSPRHQYIKHGIYVVTTTVIDPVTGEVIGKMRKTLAISTKETGEPPPSSVTTDSGKARAKEGRVTAGEAPSNTIATKLAKGRFIFSGKGRDTVTYTGKIKLPKGLDTSAPVEFSIGIGNVVASATINPRGGGIAGEAENLPQDGVLRYLKIAYGVLRSPVAKGGESATLTAVFAASALTTAGFDTEGISVRSAATVAGRSAPRQIQVAMVLDGVTYESTAPVSFSASNDSEFGAIKSRQ